MKTFLLAFDDGSGPRTDLRAFVESLDDGARMYTMDGHVCFVSSNLDASALGDRFMSVAGSSLFYITEVSDMNCSGRMVGPFWDTLNLEQSVASAA